MFDPIKTSNSIFFSFQPLFLFIKLDRAYFRHLLRAVTACNALFKFLLAFSHSKNFKFACYLGGSRLWFAPNLLKFALFCACLAFLEYALLNVQILCEFSKLCIQPSLLLSGNVWIEDTYDEKFSILHSPLGVWYLEFSLYIVPPFVNLFKSFESKPEVHTCAVNYNAFVQYVCYPCRS